MTIKEKYGYNQKNYWETTAKESNLAFRKLVDFLGLSDVEYAEDKFSPFDVPSTTRVRDVYVKLKKFPWGMVPIESRTKDTI